MAQLKDADTLLTAGKTLLAAQKCNCDKCKEFLDGMDIDFVTVSTRFAQIANKDPGKMFKILIEEWDRDRIIVSMPELYT